MTTGIVRSFNNDLGYGFIETDKGEQVFVHHSAIEMEGFRRLAPGDQVVFDIITGNRGQEASNVRKI